VGAANFEWIVRATADLAIAKARLARHAPALRWADLLGTSKPGSTRVKKGSPKKGNPATPFKPQMGPTKGG
jgi:hypothetical protein